MRKILQLSLLETDLCHVMQLFCSFYRCGSLCIFVTFCFNGNKSYNSYVSITYEAVCGGYGAETAGQQTICRLLRYQKHREEQLR